MQSKKIISRLSCATIFGASLVIGSSAALAADTPGSAVNNNYPWMYTGHPVAFQKEVYAMNAWMSSGDIYGHDCAVESSTDVDYIVMSCNGWKSVSGAGIRMQNPSAGDLDIKVYRLDGTLVGTSQGTTDMEFVDALPQQEDTIVLKVYGYAGATNSYTYWVGCYG